MQLEKFNVSFKALKDMELNRNIMVNNTVDEILQTRLILRTTGPGTWTKLRLYLPYYHFFSLNTLHCFHSLRLSLYDEKHVLLRCLNFVSQFRLLERTLLYTLGPSLIILDQNSSYILFNYPNVEQRKAGVSARVTFY